ncbi:lipopolysaccharide biosynthesis protein [Bacillus cereus group sp. BY105LC]|uniref:lipopolysaccharide biosynthesis protein n=1 Tax=Bacillus cereus group sp. BY105LC TaxID=3018088 RepID=UPI0022E96B1F|nr:oligosaccharide flippase family protein [Bacillus cereus group sp. BY105LC]MDA1886859.1 oligosaccharide flippase family protein [Bacillus cereus group sp. BY105LC]
MMSRMASKFNNGFGKAIITLVSGSLIAQAMTILVAPLLTRIYTPKELGVYTLILTAESLFGSIICGRYDVSIVSEPNEKNIYPIIKLSILITFIFSILASIGYGTYYFILKEEYQSYSYAIILIFFMLLINGLIRVLEAYNNRYKEYKVMTSVYVLRTTLQNFGAVILGIFKFGTFGLLISHIMGMLSGLKRQSVTIKPHFKKIWGSNKNEMQGVMQSHYRQPLYSVPAMFANRFSYASIGLFIESLFGLAALGLYSISYKALGLPLTVMSNNIAKIFFQEASREYDRTGGFIKSFRKTTLILLGIAIPMVLMLYFLAPFVFEIVFGPGWRQAGIYVQILAPMFGVRFIVNTVAYGLQVVKKQGLELFLQLMFILASIASFVISKSLDFDIKQYLMSITISFSLIYITYFLAVMKYAKGN